MYQYEQVMCYDYRINKHGGAGFLLRQWMVSLVGFDGKP